MISSIRSVFFKAVSLLCIFFIVFHLSSLRSNDSIRVPIIINDQSSQHGVNKTAVHWNRFDGFNANGQQIDKDLVQNDSINLQLNSTRTIPLALKIPPIQTTNEIRSNISLSANSTQNVGINDGTGQSTFLNSNTNLKPCPLQPPDLIGPIDINIEYESLELIEQRFYHCLEPGGFFKPSNCKQMNNRVAIVIPYRDKLTHLTIFLKNIHPFLMKQQADYGIFVVEQFGNDLFNRAALMNIGFLEARKLSQWDCFIFHDVDLIPLDDRNLYRCPKQPRHMSVAIDTMQFKLPYSSIFGGVSAMTVEQFQSVNGFSNAFFGWGGEDDDMSNRLKHVGYHISRYPQNIARYKMLYHRKEKANPKRFEYLEIGAKKFDSEGLNSLKYEIRALKLNVLYTWILAEIKSIPTN